MPTALPSRTPERPKVILLLSIDSLRPDHLGLYGYQRFTSPILDGIAREGVVFEDASAAAPWTLPSHASILTGLFPKNHRVVSSRTRLAAGIPTLASMLSAAGYRTAAAINIVWLQRDSYQLTRDFDDYLRVETTLDRRSTNGWVTDQAIDWIESRGDEPLFVFAHWYDLHSDYLADEAYEKLFVRPYDGPADGTGWQLKQAVLEPDYIEHCQKHFQPDQCQFGPFRVDGDVVRFDFNETDVSHLADLYDAQIRQLDAELGRLFAALRQQGIYDETLLIITSDHGQEFKEHGRFEHYIATYQETLRVPLVIRGPGLPKGLRIDRPVSSVDLVPTILSLAGAAPPDHLDGLDLSPLFSHDPVESLDERYLYAEAAGGLDYNLLTTTDFFPVFRSVRRGRYKLVAESKHDTTAVYDLKSDPGETTDIQSLVPEIASELKQELARRHEGSAMPGADAAVELDPEEVERLRALGYAAP